jgi:hypothetical protein
MIKKYFHLNRMLKSRHRHEKSIETEDRVQRMRKLMVLLEFPLSEIEKMCKLLTKEEV